MTDPHASPAATDDGQGSDGRREAGRRTRRRLIETAQDLLAERGEDAVRLRDVTTAADVNLAAVHYHFGSLRELLNAAEAEAVDQIVTAQVDELKAVAPDPTLHEICAAYFRPMVLALKGPSSRGRAYVRVLSRVTTDPPPELNSWAESATGRAHQQLLEHLRPILAVPEEELIFRVKCIGGILVLLSTLALEPHIRGRTAEEIEELIVPVVAGALTGA